MKFGDWLKPRLQDLGLREADLIDADPIPPTSLRAIIDGEREPSPEEFNKITDAMTRLKSRSSGVRLRYRGRKGRPRGGRDLAAETTAIGRAPFWGSCWRCAAVIDSEDGVCPNGHPQGPEA